MINIDSWTYFLIINPIYSAPTDTVEPPKISQSPVQPSPTNSDKSFSRHFVRRVGNIDTSSEWRRPCFNGFDKVIIGDSMTRSFGRKGCRIPGLSVTAFGGLELLELISILRTNKIRPDIKDPNIRRDLVAKKCQFEWDKKCSKCGNDCAGKFKGKVIFACGINNSLHAADLPNIKMGADNRYVNAQNFDGLFRLLDDTMTEILPEAEVFYAPLIAVKQEGWDTTELCQNAFHKINACVRRRKHVEFDPYLPINMGWIGRKTNIRDKVHFSNDYDGIDFWKMVLEQL